MGLASMIKKVWEKNNRVRVDVPEGVTTDRYLKSLRRQRQVQLEELEKKRLIKQIREHENMRNRKYIFGKLREERLKGGVKKKCMQEVYRLKL